MKVPIYLTKSFEFDLQIKSKGSKLKFLTVNELHMKQKLNLFKTFRISKFKKRQSEQIFETTQILTPTFTNITVKMALL
jgi:hypothetical protein